MATCETVNIMLQTYSDTLSSNASVSHENPATTNQADESRDVLYKLILPLLNVILAAIVLSLTFGGAAVATFGLVLSPFVGVFIYRLLSAENF